MTRRQNRRQRRIMNWHYHYLRHQYSTGHQRRWHWRQYPSLAVRRWFDVDQRLEANPAAMKRWLAGNLNRMYLSNEPAF